MGENVLRLMIIAAASAALLPDSADAQAATNPPADPTQQTEDRLEAAGTRALATNRPKRNKRSAWRLYASSGLIYSTGDYGQETRTNSLLVPFTLRARNGPFRLSATLPYLRIRGSQRVVGGGDEGPIIDDPEPSLEPETRSGFGDVNVRARYRLAPRSWKGFEVDLLGRVKLPTGSERKRLSTGETDYAVGAEFSYTKGRIEPFAEIQYRINGDPPGRDYRNTFATSIGASTRIGRRVSASMSYDYSGSRVRGRPGAHSLDGSLSTPLSRRLSLSGFGSVGLSERADDFSIGTVLTARLF